MSECAPWFGKTLGGLWLGSGWVLVGSGWALVLLNASKCFQVRRNDEMIKKAFKQMQGSKRMGVDRAVQGNS